MLHLPVYEIKLTILQKMHLVCYVMDRKSFDLETWHAALGLKLYKVCINGDPGLTLTYFTAWSNWVAGKSENSEFFRNY